MISPSDSQQAQYDELYRTRVADLQRPDTPTLTLRHLETKGLLRAGSTLLDIGCGIGKDVRLAVTQHGFSHATGVDTSQNVIKDARAVTQAQFDTDANNRVSFMQGTIFDLSSLGRYDFVLSTSVIQLMPPGQAQAFIEAAAKLREDGGILALATKTTESGDIRPVEKGGKSIELVDKGPDFELHRSNDGLLRYYYTPVAVEGMVNETGSFLDVQAETVTTPYGSVPDCEFVLVVAK